MDNNIPIPSSGKKEPTKYPFKDMQVGDSIFADWSRAKNHGSSLGWLKKKYNMEFTTRREGNGIRIWRIK